MEKERGEVVAAQYGAQISTMHQASLHVRDVNQQIQSQLSSLMGQLDGLPGAWKGAAAMSFVTLQNRWNQDATRLNNALSDIADAIAISKTGYHFADQEQSDHFSTITNALG